MTFPPAEEQLTVIRRGVEKILPEEELARKLTESHKTGKPLRIKYGIDPTGVDVHLGHTVPMRKLRQFQELGHQAVVIIGNYTALVGDPSGRDETRARLTPAQVEANAADYLKQLGKVVDLDSAEVVHNGDWFAGMSFLDVLELCGKVTVAQLLTRDDFAKRYKEESAIYLHECLYPLMQAWDSVEVRADVELGGTEQLYSFMLARDLQRDQNMPSQVSVMLPILVGIDGVRRMGKSLGNYIGVGEPPYEKMKKFMQVPDDCLRMYFELLSDFPLEEVARILSGHPKEAKMTLAKSIISEYDTEAPHANAPSPPGDRTEPCVTQAAKEAADRWEREIGKGGLPAEIPIAEIPRSELTDGKLPAAILLKLSGLCQSSGEARRAIAQGGAYWGEEKQRFASHDQLVAVEEGLMLWVGKKRFCRVRLTGD
jgi:tyrosyl-tRNA synthetase